MRNQVAIAQPTDGSDRPCLTICSHKGETAHEEVSHPRPHPDAYLDDGVFGVGRRPRALWTYEGEEGPEHWGSLSPDYAACASGLEQSPIDIPANAPLNAADIVFDYQPSPLTMVNNGHAIQANYAQGSSITTKGEKYDLLQFHFHASGEQTKAGAFSDMEVHFVHQSADGKLAVVGAFIQPGAANAAYQPVFANMPATAGDPTAVAGVTINAGDLLPV